ncbi:MAG: hypothetical protein PHE02_06085 [Lachnospiraceae bacterium]|nr:hypothetical protein [Lachnospiraceae bacterium]
MKKEVVISFIMCTITIVLLIGFTLAWYTNASEPTVTGLDLTAVQETEIKVAKEANGPDVQTLSGEDRYITIGLEDLLNVENGKFAPGAFGSVTCYVTPLQSTVKGCTIHPELIVTVKGKNVGDEDISISANGLTNPPFTQEQIDLFKIANEHIQFYGKGGLTTGEMDAASIINSTVPLVVDLQDAWDTTDNVGIEKKVTLYWKWDYEYPFRKPGDSGLSPEDRKEKIKEYDNEDTKLGTILKGIYFRFTVAPVK